MSACTVHFCGVWKPYITLWTRPNNISISHCGISQGFYACARVGGFVYIFIAPQQATQKYNYARSSQYNEFGYSESPFVFGHSARARTHTPMTRRVWADKSNPVLVSQVPYCYWIKGEAIMMNAVQLMHCRQSWERREKDLELLYWLGFKLQITSLYSLVP